MARLAGMVAGVAMMASAATASAYTLGTPSTAINTDGWALLSGNMSSFAAALVNPALFGAGGVVPEPITVQELGAGDFNAATLGGLDGLIVPWWNDAEATPNVAAIVAAFNAGMTLILLEDDTAHDAIGDALGLPTSGSSGVISSALGTFLTGPFGTPAANSIVQSGNVGQKDEAAVLASGGNVGARNASNEVTAAFWAPGTFNGNANAGALVIYADVDMVSEFSGANYTPGGLNNQAMFALNGIAFAVTATPGVNAVPAPGAIGLFVIGVVGAFAARRRSHG